MERVHSRGLLLVRAWGLEPQRITAREPKGYVTLVKGLKLRRALLMADTNKSDR